MSGGIFGDPVGAFPGQSGQGQKGVVLDNIYQVSPLFLGDLSAYFTQNPFPVPIDSLTGFDAITPYAANVKANENTSQTAYVDLATPGPSLTTLPDGTYVALYGAAMGNSNALGVRSKMALSVNGAAPDDTLQAFVLPGVANVRMGGMFATTFTLNAGGSNSLVAQYATSNASGNAQFESRWLIAIRITGP